MSFIDDLCLCEYDTSGEGVCSLGSFFLPFIDQPLRSSSEIILVDVESLPTFVESEITAEALAKLSY